MSLSVEVRVAASMVGAGAVLGVVLVVVSGLLLMLDDSFLFAVMPVVASLALGAGLQLIGGAVWLSRRLVRQAPGARLSTGILGASLVFSGLATSAAMVLPGLLLILYGGTLVALMSTAAAAADLGPWFVAHARRQGWAWGRKGVGPQRPGSRAPWEAVPQPWWELWRSGVKQGLPPVDLVVAVGALSWFGTGLLAAGLGAGLLGFGFVLVGLAAIIWVEHRMRARLGIPGRPDRPEATGPGGPAAAS